MQTETIVKTIKSKLEFEKFKDWVYIKLSGRSKEPFILPRKYFDKMEAKHSKGKVKYNWLLTIHSSNKYYALSKDYLKNYFKTGNWGELLTTAIVDPLPLLKTGVKDRYYQLNVCEDGFLKFNDKQVLRPYTIDLYGYRMKTDLITLLLKKPKIISAEIKSAEIKNVWDDDDKIQIVYMPSVQEFNKFIANDRVDNSLASYDIINRLNIEKFRKVDW